MRLTTKFNRKLWKIDSFEMISYDKESKELLIHCLDHTVLRFSSVPEDIIFRFIIDTDKEDFIKQILIPSYLVKKDKEVI